MFALRKANNITSDHLLLARRTVIIPGEFYKKGISLSPRPVDGEEEEKRKALVRRWMVTCKVSEWVFLHFLLLIVPGITVANELVLTRNLDTNLRYYT